MSDYSTNTTVNLQVNGQQAAETLANLKKHALELSNEIAKVAASGDKVTLQKLRKELRETNRQIKEMESSSMQVDNVLRRLDKATPRELQKSLHTLNKQLEYMERGTDAWTAQQKKIRMVKDEIARVNSELMRSRTFLEQVNTKWQEWQTVAMGAAAAATGVVMAGRSAVKAYAEMDEEMTNTRKYTGMTVEQVEELNEVFKKMDTRTGRDALNELAQEAGRLGKTSLEDVQGYVEAADIINVALCDLGDGATQTIAKLANIFRIDEEMGTRDAMLAVGSAVNVLSQNCTADKKYLVEFTQRMAGVGATANMAIPDLLAFGATLDANGQKCEMSASNLGKLIMQLYQKPKELAQAVGLDVEAFTHTLSTSTNEAVIQFIEQVGRLGSEEGLTRLAPLFKEMGMDGVRMSQVLATLADHIDMVRWEQVEAAKAFKEASSATNEYTLFNNTAQATLDKAVKKFKEMTIELGQELLPVMRHVVTSTSMTMKVLLQTIKFVKEHRSEIVVLTSAIAAYTVAVKAADVTQKLYNTAVKAATLVQKAFNLAVKQNPLGLIAAAVTAAIAAFVEYRKHLKRVAEEHNVLGQAEKEASKEYASSKSKVDQLSAAIHNNALSLNYRRKALKELQSIVPGYHASLTDEGKLINDNTTAIEEYLQALQKKLQFQAYEDKLAEQYAKRAEKELELDEAKIVAKKRQEEYIEVRRNVSYDATGKVTTGSAIKMDVAMNKSRSAENKVQSIEKEVNEIDEQIEKLTQKIGKTEVVVPVKVDVKAETETSTILSETEEEKKIKNKFQMEDDWKEREQALNRIAYAKGEKDYEEYTKRTLAIEVEYNEKKLQRTDLVGNEEITIQAAYEEAKFRQRQNSIEGTIEQENQANDAILTVLNQRYVDGELTARQYQSAIEIQELEHLRRVTLLYDEGSKERLKAEKTYHDTSIRYQQKHLQEARQIQEKLRETYFTKAYTVSDQESYDRDAKNLQLVYSQMLSAANTSAKDRLKIERAFHEAKYQLARKYNIKEAKDMKNSFRNAIDDSVDWLNSDAGKAMTESFSSIVSQMGAIFSGLSDIIQAELDIQTAKIEAKYDAEISAAEGNKSKEVALEQQKQSEIGKAKKEANRKMFAMQVIQAVAQTAMSAIAAYSSAAAIPMVGFVMAPIAAAMAIAAGAIQIASIKKQQEASEQVGYAEGGFTKPGGKYEEAGIVHAGEWVASQELLQNPTARAMIHTLDYAQRTNTIGSLNADDVSASITAPQVIAKASSDGHLQQSLTATAVTLKEYSGVMRELTARLNEPFVTVNTVTGDVGIKKAQDEYEQLIRNKTPKSRR